jgi:hypothetical protein
LSDVNEHQLFLFSKTAHSLHHNFPTTAIEPNKEMASSDVKMAQDPPSPEAEPKYGGFTRFEVELEVCIAT